jgi:hypothetical protein
VKLVVSRVFPPPLPDRFHEPSLSPQSQPLALLRLAMFIQDAYRVMQNKVKPVVVVAPEDADHMCLVVGYTGKQAP